MIEGTQSSLSNLLLFELDMEPGVPLDDAREVSNYVAALDYGLNRLAEGFPLSLRLLREIHGVLLSRGRGSNQAPGEFRRTQNWIGGTRPGNAGFVPPPPHQLADLLSDFEKYLHTEGGLPPLVRAGLLHVQLETIHPYLDGNGRIGRLLIMLLLEDWELLSAPLLYLSLFFKRHRDEYYRRLAAVRTEGDWEGWTSYFLEAVSTIAGEAVSTARDLFALVGRDRERVLITPGSTVMAARLFEMLPEHPILTIATAVKLLETTRPTATKAVTALVNAGVLEEISGKKRDRSFGYAGYLDLLKAGTGLER
jgi:Fic family protein